MKTPEPKPATTILDWNFNIINGLEAHNWFQEGYGAYFIFWRNNETGYSAMAKISGQPMEMIVINVPTLAFAIYACETHLLQNRKNLESAYTR